MSYLPKCILILVIASIYISVSAVPPITKCNKEDSKCLKNLVQTIISIITEEPSEFGLSSLDPVFIPEIDASTPNLQLILKDITLKGLKGCVAKKVRYIQDKSDLFMKMTCTVELDGQYEMKGKLLIIPIEGNGRIHVTLRKAVFSVDSELSEITDANGQKHINIVDWTHQYDLKDKCDLDFDNLFNGNEVLAKAAQDVIANNSNEIVLEVGAPIVKAIISRVIDSVQKFYQSYPLSDLINE